MSPADTLPDDVEALKALLRERDVRIEQMQNELVLRDAILATGRSEIEPLKLLIAKLRRMRSGSLLAKWVGCRAMLLQPPVAALRRQMSWIDCKRSHRMPQLPWYFTKHPGL